MSGASLPQGDPETTFCIKKVLAKYDIKKPGICFRRLFAVKEMLRAVSSASMSGLREHLIRKRNTLRKLFIPLRGLDTLKKSNTQVFI